MVAPKKQQIIQNHGAKKEIPDMMQFFQDKAWTLGVPREREHIMHLPQSFRASQHQFACLRTMAGLFLGGTYHACIRPSAHPSLAFCPESSRQQYETIFSFALLQIQGVVAGEANVLTFSTAGLPMGQHEL